MVLSIITRSDAIRKTINADYIMTRINPTIKFSYYHSIINITTSDTND